MPLSYIRGQTHTLASALREELERENPDQFVSCSLLHPLDTHLVVEAPQDAVRPALLRIKERIAATRRSIDAPAHHLGRATPAIGGEGSASPEAVAGQTGVSDVGGATESSCRMVCRTGKK